MSIEKGFALAEEVATRCGLLTAFNDCADPVAMRNVADHTDEWFNEGVDTFRCYYVCGGSPDWLGRRCDTLTLSAHWERLRAGPSASKQRWYCPYCGVRYVTRFGCLVEMRIQGATAKDPPQLFYARAEVPRWDAKDVKFHAIARFFSQARTPEELYAALPAVRPLDQGALMVPLSHGTDPEDKLRFSYPISGQDIMTLPMWRWDLLYQCAENARRKGIAGQ